MLRRIAFAWVLLASAVLAEEVVRVALDGPKAPVRPGETFELIVSFDIDEGYHIYGPKEKESIPTAVVLVEQAGFKGGKSVYPATVVEDMPAMGGKFDVYEGRIEVRLPVSVDPGAKEGEHALTVTIDYQACTTKTCLLPARGKQFTTRVRVAGAAVEGATDPPVAQKDTEPPPAPKPPPSSKGKFEQALNKGLLPMLLLAFGLGLAGCLTPCVYPVIPVTVSFFGSVGQGQQSWGARIARGTAYFLGIALFYAALGLFAALLSINVAQLMGNPWVVAVLCLIFLALALSMFGLYELNLPPWLLDRVSGRRQGLMGSFFLGAVMSLVAAPCVGPFVGSIFTYASTKGDSMVSFLALLSFGIGLGFPFLFLSIFAGSIQALPRAGEWMNRLKLFFGFLMLGMIVYFIEVFLPDRWASVLWGVFAVFWGTFTGAFNPLTAESGAGARFAKALGILIVLTGVILFAKGLLVEEEQGIPWCHEYAEARERAESAGKPMFIDFRADT